MYTVNEYCRKKFGRKLYKLSLNGHMTCPTRDGTLDSRGCIFCSASGSGDFTNDIYDIDAQIDAAKALVAHKFKGDSYIAYFQSYTNTYAPVSYLRELFLPVIKREDIACLSIATRPDCLGADILELISELNQLKPVWVELGLQTVHERSAEYIRRHFPVSVYDSAITSLNNIGVHTITHVILGLPCETEDDMLKTVEHVIKMKSAGIKLQLLHVLKDTDLAIDYASGLFEAMTLEQYISVLKKCVAILPDDMVVHKLTGDGPKKLLIAPKWSANKKMVINTINKEFLK